MKALRIAFFACVLSVFFSFTAFADNNINLTIPYLDTTTAIESWNTTISASNGFTAGDVYAFNVNVTYGQPIGHNYNGGTFPVNNLQYTAHFSIIDVRAGEGVSVSFSGNRVYVQSEYVNFQNSIPITIIYSVTGSWTRGIQIVDGYAQPLENCYLSLNTTLDISNVTYLRDGNSDIIPSELKYLQYLQQISGKLDDILTYPDKLPPDFLGPDAIVYFDARYFPNVNAKSGSAYFSRTGDKYNDYFIHLENAGSYINVQNGQVGTGVFLSEGQYFFVYAADQYLADVALAGWQGKYSITNKYFSKNAEFYFTVFEVSVNEPMLVMNVQVLLDSNLNGILFGGIIPKSSDDTLGDALNPNQNNKNNELNSEANTQSQQENQLWQNVNTYKSQLDFNLSGWNEATSGLSYVSNIFMLIWNNSPRQIITLSLMLGIGMLAIGRGVKAAVRQKDGDS